MNTLFAILLGGILVNNYALEQLLGLTPMLGLATRGKKTLGMGLGVTLVMLLSTALLWPVENLLLAPLKLEYLQTVVFLAVILAVVYLLEVLARKLIRKSLGVYFPVIALNGAVLGLALNAAGEGYTFPEALAVALGVGLGFLLGLELLEKLQVKLHTKQVPAAFRGLPIQLVMAGIVAMALLAFK